MAEYVTTFTKPYPSGYQDLPSEATPVGHEIIESWENAIVSLESYLSENNIQAVSASTTVKSGTKTATITIDGTEYIIYSPSVSYESAITGGTKVGTITVGANTFDVYAPTSSAGGSTVSVVPKTLTGTNIAEITVDGTTYQLYAPTSGGGSGSTVTAEAILTEGTQIGKITIDGVETILYAPTASAITVDSELSATSENAVQNKAIAEEFQKYANGTKVVAKATEANTATTASNAEKVNGHTVGTDVPSNAVFTDTVYDDSAVKASIQNIVNGTTQVGSATKATQDAQGNVIDTTYAKKTEVPQGTVVDDALSSTSTNPVQNKVVKAEFDKVNSNLSQLEYEIYDNSKSQWVIGAYTSTGDANSWSGYHRTVNYTEVTPNTTYTISNSEKGNFSNGICYYDANKTFLSWNLYVENGKTFKTPSNCKYIRFTVQSENIPTSVSIKTFNSEFLTEEVKHQNEILDNQGLLNKFDGELVQGYPGTNNIIETYDNANYVCSKNPIDCNGGDYIEVKNQYTNGSVYFYDSSKAYISQSEFPCTAPTNAKYFRFRIGYVENITPQTAGKISVYINNAIDEIKNDLSNLKDGTTPVSKAVADEDGNNIKSTYATKTEVVAVEDVEVEFNSELFSNPTYYCKCIGKMCFLYFTAAFKKSGSISHLTSLISIKNSKYYAITDYDSSRLFIGSYGGSDDLKGNLVMYNQSTIAVQSDTSTVLETKAMWGSIQWMIK